METKNNLEKELHAMQTNETYQSPAIEIIEMEMEGILCTSNGENYGRGGGKGWKSIHVSTL